MCMTREDVKNKLLVLESKGLLKMGPTNRRLYFHSFGFGASFCTEYISNG